MPEVISNQDRRGHPFDEQDPEAIVIPPVPEFDEAIDDVVTRVQQLVGKVAAPKSLDRPHALIGKVLAADEARREKQLESGYSWDGPLFGSPYEKRRLRILSALFNALERCGANPWISGKECVEAGARVGDSSVSFRLDDPAQPADRYRPTPAPNRSASDDLQLRITFPSLDDGFTRSWADGQDASIESRLTEIAVTLVVLGEVAYRLNAEHQREWALKRRQALIDKRIERIEKARREEQEQLEQARQARVDRLLGEAASLRQANDIREYVETVRRHATGSKSDIERWSAWALGVADSIDPVLSGAHVSRHDGPLSRIAETDPPKES
jgi:hypothetical protein